MKYDAAFPSLALRLAVSTLLPVKLFLRANCLPTCGIANGTSLAKTLGLRPVECAIKYNHGDWRVYAWSGIKAVCDVGKMTMAIFVLRASLHGIGNYGALDVASPQSGNIGEQPMPSPHFGGLCGSSENRCRIGILLWVSS